MDYNEKGYEAYKENLVNLTFSHQIVQNRVAENFRNFSQMFDKPIPDNVIEMHKKLTEAVVDLVLRSKQITINVKDANFKKQFAHHALKICSKDLLQGGPLDVFVEEIRAFFKALRKEMGAKELDDTLFDYFITKFISVVSQVCIMRMNNLEPGLLRLTNDEANKSLLGEANRIKKRGGNVINVDLNKADPEGVAQSIEGAIKGGEIKKN